MWLFVRIMSRQVVQYVLVMGKEVERQQDEFLVTVGRMR